MSDFRIATRYAKSLLELAQEKGVLDQVNADMIVFDNLCKSNKDFALMLKNPIIQHHQKLTILRKIFKGKVNDLTLAIFDIVTRKNREFILPAMAGEFTRQYYKYKGIAEASVTTNFPLSEDLRTEFTTLLKNITQKEVKLEEKLDTSMLGGFIVRIGDRQIDDSIDTRLQELRTKLTSKAYIRKY